MRWLLAGVLLFVGVSASGDCGIGPNLLQAIVGAPNPIECGACSLGLAGIKALAKLKPTEFLVETVGDLVCQVKKIEDSYVCAQIMNEYKDLVMYLVENELLTAQIGCGVLGFCQKPDFPVHNVSFTTPKPPLQPYPAAASSDRMYVLHLSDIHVDIQYSPGYETNCGEPICCRPSNGPGKTPETSAGVWGDYNCDAPPALYEHALGWVKENLPDIDFAVVTGDLPAHNVWEITRTEAVEVEDLVANAFMGRFPKAPYYAAVGNHESVPVNQFVPRDLQPQPRTYNMSWLYDSLADKWSRWLAADVVQQARYAGYYTTLVPGTEHDEYPLRIVSLNTNLGCNDGNFWLWIPSKAAEDPDGMIEWAVSVLTEAEKKGEKVYFIEHIALSDSCGKYWPSWHKVLERFENTILGNFAGHTHDDKYTVTYDQNKRAFGATFFPGSITPEGRNPGFRVYEIDRKTKAVLDFTQYWANLTEANMEDSSPKWLVEYKASESYGVKSLAPEEFHLLSQRMHDDKKLLVEYTFRLPKLFDNNCTRDDGCLRGALCDTYNAAPGSPSICGT
eukprot:TRINITY_DN30897_c0_g1_i1.p1 TRINITY_DN30897_c0_g1~~TRINITY_DN30897_c0_g1_i1.p1  ORF type:complete len:561 (-),score=125.20 TRINITY_DN30897_c0_g1_i1:1206-2888(-)